MNRAGDITITVNKDELLTKLKENRETHHELYEKAWEGYCKLARQTLEEMLDTIKQKKPIGQYFKHTPPEDHTADYDDVIDMLSWSLGSEVELTQTQFIQYVKDDFGWKETWTTSNTGYIQASGR
jgi:adenine-specific DNA methylase